MTGSTDADAHYLAQAIDLSARFHLENTRTPFGSVVVRDGRVLGRGCSRVVELHDPVAHAEVEALQNAARHVGNHLLTGATLYCSAFPCPLCLMAARWADISRVVYAAELSDSRAVGFQDAQFYQQLENISMWPVPIEAIGPMRTKAVCVLRDWKSQWSTDAPNLST